jgi:hypothetical protein
MSLNTRIRRLEQKARAEGVGELTLAVVRRMMDGGLTEAEWKHYGPILKSWLHPDEAKDDGSVPNPLDEECRPRLVARH